VRVEYHKISQWQQQKKEYDRIYSEIGSKINFKDDFITYVTSDIWCYFLYVGVVSNFVDLISCYFRQNCETISKVASSVFLWIMLTSTLVKEAKRNKLCIKINNINIFK
jgi:hypothetical protein